MVNLDLLQRLVGRGDGVSILNGRLHITSVSGETPPATWLKQHGQQLTRAIVEATAIDALTYSGYTTGRFHHGRAPGVILYFTQVQTCEESRAFYNARLTRTRTTKSGKKGDLLPQGKFSVGKKSSFTAFWQRAGLPLPRSTTEFWEYMGNLKPILFKSEIKSDGVLDKDSITPLTITPNQVRDVVMGNQISPITDRYLTDNSPITDRYGSPISKSLQPPKTPALQPNESTGSESAYKVLSITGNVTPLYTPNTPDLGIEVGNKNPSDQTDDEWLDEYING